jgi:hypothetical protein
LVLVAESSGAHVARLFTAAHPSRVRALVLVDPSFDDLDRQRRQWSSEERQRAARLRKLAHIVPALSQVGLHRPLLGPRIADALETYPEELRSLVREQLLSRKSVAVLVQRALDREAGLAAVREASLPRRLPLVVLTAEIRDPQDPTPYETEKLAYHRELSERSERGRHVVLADTPHAVIGDRPRRVAEAVLAMIEAAPEESREALRLAGESVPSEGRTQTWGWPKAPKPMSRAENVGTSVLFLSARWTATEVAGTLFGVLLLVGLAGSQLHGMIVGDLPANDFFVGLTGVFALFGWALLHSHSRLVRIELTADAEAVSRPRISAGRRTGSLRPGYLDRRRGDAARRDAPPTTRERS